MQISFKNVKNIYKNNINVKKLYKGNILLWELVENNYNPLNLLENNNVLSFLDVNSDDFDFNKFISVFIEYLQLYYKKRNNGSTHLTDLLDDYLKGHNLIKDSKTMTEDWIINTGWSKDLNKFNDNDVYKFNGSWSYVAYPVKLNSKDKGKIFTFSLYAKTENTNNINGSLFITDREGNNVTEVTKSYVGIELSNNWTRYSITFTFTGDSEKEIVPNLQLPNNNVLYVSSYMLNEGNIAKDWDNGSYELSNDCIKLLSELDEHIFNYGIENKNKYVIYNRNYSNDLNNKIRPYINKVLFEHIDNIDDLISKIRIFNFNSLPDKDFSKLNNDNLVFKKSFNFNNKFIGNVNIGYASYSRWGEYSDDIKTVYMDMRWNEVENIKGVYNWENWENLTRWNYIKSKGYNVIFRLILDEPTDMKHSDMPEYLTNSKYGSYYSTDYGKGFTPYYDNIEILDNYKKFVNALIERYINKEDNIISSIQFGIIGHWGEFHIHPNLTKLPNSNTIKEYLLPFVSKTENIDYMFRRPFKYIEEFQINYPNNTYGVFNDMIGDKTDTEEWLSWLENGGTYDSLKIEENDMVKPYPNYYEKGLVGGEFTSSTSMKTMLVDKLDQTINLIKKSHTSLIGQKIPLKENVSDDEYDNAYEKIKNELGYKLCIKNIKIESGFIYFTLKNLGNVDMIGNYKISVKDITFNKDTGNEILLNGDITGIKAGQETVIQLSIDKSKLNIYNNTLVTNVFSLKVYKYIGNKGLKELNLCNSELENSNEIVFNI